MKRITMTAKEAAEYIGISYWRILELTKQKQIPFSAVGGRKLFRKDTLDKWLEDLEKQSVEIEAAVTTDEYGKLRKIF
jgi:excisionase family DNA binding protein